MIEVITYVNLTLRLINDENYKEEIENLLTSNHTKIQLMELSNIEAPKSNYSNGALETNCYGKFIILIPEKDNEKNIEAYTDDIIPFFKRELPNCNAINHIKIVHIKRIVEDNNIVEHSIMFD